MTSYDLTSARIGFLGAGQMATALAAGIQPHHIHLSIDTNEACAGPAFLLEMLDYMAHESPGAASVATTVPAATAVPSST